MGSPTPTPLKVGRVSSTHNHPVRFWEVEILDADGGDVGLARGAGQMETLGRASLFVKAVNSHERLLMELNACRVYVEEAIKLASDRRSPDTMMRDRLRSVSDAIALAEGSTPDVHTEKK